MSTIDTRGGIRVEDLLRGSAFPHEVGTLRLEETHLSWILLTGPYAYKIKKPVRFDFVDASTLERRRFLCGEELRLNRRFAPDLYVDVVPIVRKSGTLRVDDAGEPVEYAVRMHQFDASQELGARLDRGLVTATDMQQLGAHIAEVHERAPVAENDSQPGAIDSVRQPMLDNFPLLRRHLVDTEHRRRIVLLEQWTREALARLEPLIVWRRRSGMVRECHGDLHARNVVHWRQRWQAFDCLEFDPGLRWIDVLNDVAFLFMDLVSRSRTDLACDFLSRYLESAGDYAGLRLMPLYCAYRALVRAKVDVLGAESSSGEARRDLQTRLERRLATATAFAESPTPALVIMHGVTASGKSWLSERLIGPIGALRIRSDLERKRLNGVPALAHRSFAYRDGAYSGAATKATYERLLASADAALEGGCSVIVDASFLDRRHRDAFRSLARRRNSRFLVVSCVADGATLASRLNERAASGRDPSEATQAVLARQLADAEPLQPDEFGRTLEIDMRAQPDPGALAARVRSRLLAYAD